MKTPIVFVIFANFVICARSVENSSLVPLAISSILKEYFVENSPEVNLIYFGDSQKFEYLVDQILKVKPLTILLSVSKGGIEKPWNYRLNCSAIVLFDSVKTFKKNVENIEWLTNIKKRYAHLVYAKGLTKQNIIESVENGFLIDKVGFLMNETEKSIELVASFMYTAQKCRPNQLFTINSFMRNNYEWESSNFYPKKYDNFHGCGLLTLDEDILVLELFNAVSRALNFTMVMSDNPFFARYLLILFICWSLIIRTCYQSMLFTYL